MNGLTYYFTSAKEKMFFIELFSTQICETARNNAWSNVVFLFCVRIEVFSIKSVGSIVYVLSVNEPLLCACCVFEL